MAFSKSPTEDTVSVQRVNIAREIAARDGGNSGKDVDLLNVYVELVKKPATNDSRQYVQKRAGVDSVIASISSSAIRGMFFWEDQYKLYYVIGTTLYIYNVLTGTSTSGAVWASTTGPIGFCLFQYSTGSSKVVATDGTSPGGLVTIDSANTVVANADADMPTHLPYPVYLDGYIFIAKSSTADIYNSNNDDPLAWTAGDFITAEMEADNLVRLAKVNNYIVAFGTNSVEYFWDAAVATGSPLQRNDTPVKFTTYLGGYTQYANAIYFIGVNESGQPDVFALKDFKIENLGTPTISRYLNSVTTPVTTWYGSAVSFKGHSFYAMNAGTEKTYVMDLESKLWSRWGFQGLNAFNIQQALTVTTLSNSRTYFCLDATNAIYKFNDVTYTDNGTSISCIITSEAEDFGTLNRKTMRRISIIGDRPPSSNNATISWSDNDGQIWSSGLETNMNQDLPCVYRTGSFRQRSIRIAYSANTDFRIQAIEVEINKGRS